MFIYNASAIDFKKGNHPTSDNMLAIQIVDPAGLPPQSPHAFKETHIFEFLDIEDNDEYVDEFGVTDEQAEQLVALLRKAIEQQMDIVVHCTAGMCRSGAVVEVGVMMGFTDPLVFRLPNTRVKQKMMKSLGWTYD